MKPPDVRTLAALSVAVLATVLAGVVALLAWQAYQWSTLATPPEPAQLRRLAVDLALSWLAVAGASVLAAMYLGSMLAAPMRALERKLTLLSRGHLDERMAPEGPLEARAIAHRFNEAAAALASRERHQLHRERLATVEMLLSGVAHHVNTPLTSLKVNNEAAIQQLEKGHPGAAQQALEIARRNRNGLRRLEELVLALRETASADGTAKAAYDPNLVVQGALLLLEQPAWHRIQVETRLEAKRLVAAPGHELAHVLVSLVLNAAQAMPQGGTLRVATEDRGGEVAIHVHNTGPPLPEPVRSRIFRETVTTKPRASGLGLLLAAETVRQLGGTLAHAQEADGPTFTVALPAAA